MNMKDVENMITRHRNTLQEILVTMGVTIDVGEALEHDSDSKVQEMEETIRSLIEMEQKLKDHISALETLRDFQTQRIQKGDDFDLQKYFNEQLQHIESKVRDKNSIKKHQKYREFKQKIWHVNHPSEALPDEQDEELVVMSQKDDNLTCPLSRSLLVEPTRSQTCGHVYSKAAVMKYLAVKKGRGRCPVAGCNQIIDKETLEDDVDMTRKLKKYLKTSKKRKNQEAEEESEYTQL